MAPYNNAPETGTRNGRSADRGAGAGALVGGALFVSVIALCALFIAYEGIYRLAAIVHAESTLPLAHVFPVTFTLLVLMAFWVSYILRTAPPRERLWIDIGLIPLLILSAAVPMALTRTAWFGEIGDTLPRGLTVVVAVAPLAALLVAFLLWIAVRAHVRRRGTMARPRPKPSDDRTTVLRGTPKPRPGPEEETSEAPEALRTRLLRLGGDPEAAEVPETVEASMPSEEAFEPEEPVRIRRIESDESREGSERADDPDEGTFDDDLTVAKEGPEAPTEPIPNPWDRADDETSMEVSQAAEPEPPEAGPFAATIPLPRRARTGDNPIKRAATEPPMVPGAAAPDPAESTGSYAYASDTPEDPEDAEQHCTDEGFVHTPEVGDPSADEAEAPIPVPPVVEPEAAGLDTDVMDMDAEEDAHPPQDANPLTEFEEIPKRPERLPGVRLFFPEHSPDSGEAAASTETAGAASEAFEPSEAPAEAVVASGSESSVADETAEQEDHIPLWEPPSDDHSASALDEYVPPVWTPPEDDTPAPDVPAAPIGALSTRTDSTPGPALDHDTGPAVRAAFRLGSVPPGAARPEPEPRPKAGSAPEPGEDPARAFTTEETDRSMEPAGREEERPEGGFPQSSPRRTDPLRKRPMVLKPPRPPMPDFASGPPSRRVRSEPLPPGDD